MTELSQRQKEQIYLEEKLKREGRRRSSGSLLILNALALAGLAGILYLAFKSDEARPSVEDFRRSYDGLSPEDMESYTGSAESLH